MKPRSNKKSKLSSKNNVSDTEPQIKYDVQNTQIPVKITVTDELILDVSEEDYSLLQSNDVKKQKEYTIKLDKTIQYLLLEGFIDVDPRISISNITNN